MRNERIARLVMALVIFILFFGPLFSGGITLLVDWLWFKQMGFASVYLTLLQARLGVSGAASLFFIVGVGFNLLLARRIAHNFGYKVTRQTIEFPALDRFTNLLRGLVWLGLLFLAYMVGDWASTHGMDYLMARHGVPIPQPDPLFHIGLRFYLFQLPFIWFLYHLALVTLLASIAGAVMMFLLEGGVWITPQGASVARGARGHLMALGALVFLLFAYRARLAMFDLLYSPRGLLYGAGYTDVHATLPVLWILLALCVITALALAANARSGSLRAPLLSGLALVAVAIVGGAIYPAIVQQYVVTPNEIDKERPYIARAIEFTRKAYALDRFDERQFSDVEDLTASTIQENAPTMRNIRLWDHKPLSTTFSQLQEIRTYYDFVHVDNDRYWIDNTYRQVSLSARELSTQNLPSRNWINEHLTYTHGFGAVVGPVNESTPDGLPVLFVKNIPPVSTGPLHITRPEIYYGELANRYVFVRTRAQEFDYPSGDQNVYTTYQGSGGITVGGFWRRLLFTLRYGEINIILSSDIQSSSRIMIHRQILDAASRLAPFLRFDHDAYLVIADDGSLYWMLDAYTTSDQYPYSNPTENMGNYIRNSVKVTVNAYDGAVRYYVSDPSDPLIQTYARIFPGVFSPLSRMPRDLRAHIRYPLEFFSIQAAQYATFHMTDPRVFYSKEDLWRVAQSASGGNGLAPMAPYYTIMKLAEVGKQEEFILMVPFTPARKQNMIAWMAARCDGPDYGKVLVFNFPKQKLVYGPQQIESRIDQDPAISQQLTLWNQGGSTVIRGTLLVVPVRNSVLYVEPLYLAAQAGGGLPQLKRVIVAYSDHVVMETSLEAALDRIFGSSGEAAQTQQAPGAAPATGAAAAPAGANEGQQQMIREAEQHFQRAQQLLRQGDWAGYGEEMKKVGDTLQKLNAPRQ
jgi:uncharacterized membrane protein (UPF0182 family)